MPKLLTASSHDPRRSAQILLSARARNRWDLPVESRADTFRQRRQPEKKHGTLQPWNSGLTTQAVALKNSI